MPSAFFPRGEFGVDPPLPPPRTPPLVHCHDQKYVQNMETGDMKKYSYKGSNSDSLAYRPGPQTN